MLGGFVGLVGLSAVAGVLVTATVTPAIAVSGYAATSAIEMFDNMPSYLEIDELMLPTQIYAKDSGGNDVMLAEFYDQNRIPMAFDQVSPVVFDAILSSEDKNFYSHGGVDLLGTMSALIGNASSGGNRGGSSITQQYVKNVLQQTCEADAKSAEEVAACFSQTTIATGSAGYQRKLQEMRYAIQLEKEYSKDEILIGYLNIAHFGGSVYGIGAAAEYYFATTPDKLTIGQAAAIAGMVQEPNTLRIDRPEAGTRTNADGVPVNTAADGYSLTKKRQVYVLGRMLKDGKITQAEHDEAVAAPLEPHITARSSGCTTAVGAEFFCDYVTSIIKTDAAFGESKEERQATLRRGGLKVYTTLDADLQAAANEAISIVPPTVPYMDLGASGIQIEVGTGRVLSMVQNRPYSPRGTEDGSTTAVNYNVRGLNGGGAGHPAGSTYKVFSLINWLEQGRSVNEMLNGRVGDKRIQTCDGATQRVKTGSGSDSIGNFESSRGYNGSVYNFTKDSLNSGFLAMAEIIPVCTTNAVAMKMGVMRGDGTPLDNQNAPYDVLGSANVAPIDMANAYATIASGGILCEPKAIDRVLDANGEDHPLPERSCERVISEGVAATAAYTLESVMGPGGTGVGARTNDGTPIFGKTGIHQFEHTWMDGASSKVATAVWVGNVEGFAKLDKRSLNGYRLSRIRNAIWPDMQRAANRKYGGEAFPRPDDELTKKVYVDVPSVIGLTVDEARSTLEEAGFSVNVTDPVDGVEPEGTIVSQDPPAGRAVGGTTIAISPSNGQGVVVPGVSGTPEDAAAALRAAGFSSISAQCTEVADAPSQGVVTGTSPAAGTAATRDTGITIQYESDDCSGRPGRP